MSSAAQLHPTAADRPLTPRLGAEFVFLAAVWGASFLFMRQAVVEFGPLPTAALRVAIAALALQTATGQPLPVTISLGVAMCDPKAPDNTERLLSAADTALYQAKRHGRNRVCSYHAGDAHR